MVKRWIEKCYVGLVLFLLYAPIAILIVCSFNASKSRRVWGGFTFQWYIELFQDEAVIGAVRTSLMLTTVAAIVAVLLGTLASIGITVMGRSPMGDLLSLRVMGTTLALRVADAEDVTVSTDD